jgi:hypothetical protein
MRSTDMLARNSTVLTGKGVGTVLLQIGGPGPASSYESVEDYEKITGVNPYAKTKVMEGSTRDTQGKGVLSKLTAERLRKLTANPGPRRKNITMSM